MFWMSEGTQRKHILHSFFGRSHGRVVAASEGRGRGGTCVDSSSVDHEMAGAQGRMEVALCVEEREVSVDLAGASLV